MTLHKSLCQRQRTRGRSRFALPLLVASLIAFSLSLGLSAQTHPRPDAPYLTWDDTVECRAKDDGSAHCRVAGQREDEKPREFKKDGISLLLFGDKSQTAAAITVESSLEADLAIVRIVYETYYHEIPIVLVKESVVSAMSGIHVMSDPVPVSLDKVRSVQVRLVRQISETKFDLKNGEKVNPQTAPQAQEEETPPEKE